MRSYSPLKKNLLELHYYYCQLYNTSSVMREVTKMVDYFCYCLKKNQNAPRPSEHPPVKGKKMSKRLGGIKGCKYKTSPWNLNGFPDGNNIGPTV